MAEYKIQAPDGTILRIEGPDDATDEELQQIAEEHFAPHEKSVGQFAKNVGTSALNLGKGIVHTVAHPADTVYGLGNAIWGAAENLMPGEWAKAIPGNVEHQKVAGAIGKFYADRYGSLDKAKEALYTDPVGVLADLSTVFTGMGGAATKLGKVLPAAQGAVSATSPVAKLAQFAGNVVPQTGEALTKAGQLTNPVSVVTKPLGALSTIPRELLGAHSGVGGESISQARKAGRTGNVDFLANMRGEVPFADVVDSARSALGNMRTSMMNRYSGSKEGALGWAADKTPLSFAGIDDAFNKFMQSRTTAGHSTIDPAQMGGIQKIQAALDEWRADPVHTVESLDALKRRIASIAPDNPEFKDVRAAVGTMTKAVKNEITKQAPQYKSAMQDYWKSSQELDEIERSLSLGERASVDTALRKLQSLTRNNASTNYGNRLSSAETLAEKGGIDIMPAIAGQSMSSLMPRGLARYTDLPVAGAAATVAGLPTALGALTLSSPRVLGELTYKLGQVEGALPPLAEAGNLAGVLGRDVESYADGGLAQTHALSVEDYVSALKDSKSDDFKNHVQFYLHQVPALLSKYHFNYDNPEESLGDYRVNGSPLDTAEEFMGAADYGRRIPANGLDRAKLNARIHHTVDPMLWGLRMRNQYDNDGIQQDEEGLDYGFCNPLVDDATLARVSKEFALSRNYGKPAQFKRRK